MMISLVVHLALAAGSDTGQDFTAEAKLLYRVVACGGDAALPANIDAKVVEAHCREVEARVAKYRATWVNVAKPFIQKLKPSGLPTTLVYPFGGGDLLSALTTFPEATDITTMSLEHGGDPRRIHTVTRSQLKASLDLVLKSTAGLMLANDSKTENLMKAQRGELPGQLSFFLLALKVHGFEPVSLRYVTVGAGGALQGVTEADIAAREKENAKLLKKGWVSPDFSPAFSNIELTFAPIGSGGKGAITHRHFAANLDDAHFGKDENLKAFLEGKGRIVAMTKAASYLLWRENFSTIRDFLLSHMEFMVSDSTGIPPKYAGPAGFEQVGFGKFTESFLGAAPAHNAAFRKVWAGAEPLSFRYGYLDKALSKHMLITRKKAAVAP